MAFFWIFIDLFANIIYKLTILDTHSNIIDIERGMKCMRDVQLQN